MARKWLREGNAETKDHRGSLLFMEDSHPGHNLMLIFSLLRTQLFFLNSGPFSAEDLRTQISEDSLRFLINKKKHAPELQLYTYPCVSAFCRKDGESAEGGKG